MRKILVALATLLLAGSVQAATFPYTGTLAFGLATLPGAGGAGTGSYVGTGAHIATINFTAGQFGPINVSLPVTNNSTIQSVRLSNLANLTGTLGPISGGGAGPMGLQGMAKICLVLANFVCAYGNVPVPLTPTGSPVVGIGVGGTQFVPGGVALTMQHASWTVGQPVMTIHSPLSTVSTPTLPGGFAHGPASLTSSTASPSGVLQLVTVTKVYTSLKSAFPELPVYASLTLRFVPEPGTLLLLGSGVAGLAILGRRRSRR